MIYTSYFAVISRLPDYIEPVSIARWSPSWYRGKTFQKLAPPRDIFDKYERDKNEADYIQAYRKRVLSRLYPDNVIRELHTLTDKLNIALICYEKPDDFCHRHLVADWLNEHGIECLEWKGESA